MAPSTRPSSSGRLPRRPPVPEVLRAIDSDPAFAVVTLDGSRWVDPYTGQTVPLPRGIADRVAVAREHLTDTGHWKNRVALPLAELLAVRWHADLLRLVPSEPRLRIFNRDGQQWLNPWTGQLVLRVAREDGRLTERTIGQMARQLATCPEARGAMLEQAVLIARGQALGVIGSAKPSSEGHSNRPGTGSGNRPSTDSRLDESLGSGAMAADLARARSVQQHQLSELPRLPGLTMAVHNSAHQGVSGDFYLAIPVGEGTVLTVLGDVTGHGMQAALVVAGAMKTFRLFVRQIDAADPAAGLVGLLSRFNDEIKADLLPGQFITLTVSLVDPLKQTATVVLAGHHPALVMNLESEVILRRFGLKGMAVGIASGETFARTLRLETIELAPGDVVVQYSDGLIEAADAREAQFGESGLYGALLARAEEPLQDLVDVIAADARIHARGEPGDDLTILAIAVVDEADGLEPGEATAE